MKYTSKPTVLSSDDNLRANSRLQQEAFLASSARMQASEDKINELSRTQYQLSDTVSRVERSIEEVTEESRKKADQTLKEATDGFNQKVKSLGGKLDKKMDDLSVTLDKKVLEGRNKIIEPLAIFVGLFTFVSIGFQIFTQVKEYILWMPLLAAVLGGIIIFAGLVIHASSMNPDAAERRKYTAAVIALGAVILIGAGFYYHQAIEVLRVEDAKKCIVVTESADDEVGVRYCKLTR